MLTITVRFFNIYKNAIAYQLIICIFLDLASVETIQAVVRKKQEKISIIKLRSQLFLRFRITVRKVVEPRLTSKVKKIDEDFKGDYFVENCDNLDRDMDYSFFLKQLEKDLKAGHLSSFLRAKGIVDLADLFSTCEFALKGDKQAFDYAHHRTGLYYIEEEVSHCNSLFSAPFDKAGTLDMIKHVSYSEAMQMNCRKMVDYLSRL